MTAVFRTENMEADADTLAAAFTHVIALLRYVTPLPVRFRPKLLKSPAIYYRKNRDTAGIQVAGWEKNGGILLDYGGRKASKMKLPAHDAVVVVEPPPRLSALEALFQNTAECALIFKPPTWDAHAQYVENFFPDYSLAVRFDEALEALTAPGPKDRAILKAVGKNADGLVAITDDDLAAQLGIAYRPLQMLRRKCLQARGRMGEKFFAVQPFICRVEPKDRTLMHLYTAIRDGLPAIGGVRYAVDSKLLESSSVWRAQLRKLTACGSVQKKAKIGFYLLDGRLADYGKLRMARSKALAEFEVLKQYIDTLPVFTPASLDRLPAQPVKPPQLFSPAQRAAARLASDTDR